MVQSKCTESQKCQLCQNHILTDALMQLILFHNTMVSKSVSCRDCQCKKALLCQNKEGGLSVTKAVIIKLGINPSYYSSMKFVHL